MLLSDDIEMIAMKMTNDVNTNTVLCVVPKYDTDFVYNFNKLSNSAFKVTLSTTRTAMLLSPLVLTACKGSSSDGEEEQAGNSSSSQLAAHKIPFDVTNLNLQSLPWLTPAASGTFGRTASTSNESKYVIMIPAMFDVEHGSIQTDAPEGHLFIYTLENGLFSQTDDIIFVGTPRPYLYDFNGDGIDEVVGITLGEDGRLIRNEADVATRPFYFNPVDGSIVYFGENQWHHASAFQDINYDGIPDLIVAPIGYEPQSKVYNIVDFSEIIIQHQFKGDAEGDIPFSDLDGDGLLEFVETDSSWDGVSNDNALMLDLYEVNMDGTVSNIQSIKFGELDGGRFSHTEWNGQDPNNYYTGNAFGVSFNLLHRWHGEFVDIDGDTDEDLILIYSIDINPSNLSPEHPDYQNPIHIITIDSVNDALDYSTMTVTNVEANFVGKGWSFKDLNDDGFIDMYLDINLMAPDFTGSDLGDRIWLNDGYGQFTPVGDRADDSLYGREFMSSGEYSIYNINEAPYLAGITSMLDGSDLSFILIPINDII
jgi:hypothetical protein